jgi:hypothetical protein
MPCIPPLTATRSLWYSVALKAPKGDSTHVFWPERGYLSITRPTIIQNWLEDVFTHSGNTWDGRMYYNDQLPDGVKESEFLNGVVNDGHCKGVVVWNAERVGWLVHSIPKFPAIPKFPGVVCATGALWNVPESGLTYGQSAVYVEFPRTRDTLDDVCIQLSTMRAQIYDHAGLPDLALDSMRRIYACKTAMATNTWVIDQTRRRAITHIAKPGSLPYDIYSTDIIKPRPGTGTGTMPIVCETWQNGSGGKIANVAGVTNLRAVGSNWESAADHSKWAISMPYCHRGWFRTYMKNDWRVFIGDLNRMDSQKVRGGGGIIIDGDRLLWEWFYAFAFGA